MHTRLHLNYMNHTDLPSSDVWALRAPNNTFKQSAASRALAVLLKANILPKKRGRVVRHAPRTQGRQMIEPVISRRQCRRQS
jgi:hypothetical protein